MKNFTLITLFLLLCLYWQSCSEPPQYPIEPAIVFAGLDKDTLQQGVSNADKVRIKFTFTDGDGDLGNADSTINIFLKDLRNNQAAATFQIPFIPVAGTKNGISGDITIAVNQTCCLPSCEIPKNAMDTLRYEIFIKDRAGHESNRITTTPIALICK